MNREYLASITGDDRDFERELTESFVTVSPSIIEQLRVAAESADATAVRSAAHALKGSSRAIGADGLGALCEDLEHRARDGDVTDAAKAVDGIAAAYAHVESYIRDEWLS
jgi:HPt (histidine-containing phosphotransfer) domain-containing protein